MTEEKNNGGKIEKREITTELKESYLDYAMSVIVSRALPDVRDGLKPVHRRILWSMWESGLSHTAKFRKSANIVGETMARYHPHGDMAIYDSLVRMAQDFSLRYPLVKGQGNWGSIDGDSAAAQRYTEARLARIAEELLQDIEKETVDWLPNYDGTRNEPRVVPAKLPNLLLNGGVGIAVGMATNIPPHNLTEVADAITHLIEHPKATTEDLMEFVQGPDFPTGAIMYNKKAIIEAYVSGRGAITVRAVSSVEERKGGQFNIVVTEIPYQVNKAELLIKIAELVQTKKIEGIRDLRDESDREGMRIVIELKNDVLPQKIVNQLYKYTDLQKDFHLNMIALVNGIQPQLLSLKDIVAYYLEHRTSVVTRRAEFDLKKAKERAHILEGLWKALGVIDKIIATIKKSKSREEAHTNLMKEFKLTDVQSTAILEMRLQTLAALERQKIEDELNEKKKLILELEALLKSPAKILKVVKDEVADMKKTYGDARRTKLVVGGLKEFIEEDLIAEEEVVITLSQSGYIKRVDPASFKAQRRGGKGLIGQDVGEEDFITHFLSGNTHDNILFFTNLGRVFQTKVHEIPAGSRTSKGKIMQNFLDIPADEKVSAIVAYSSKGDKEKSPRLPAEVVTKAGTSASNLRESAFLVMVTKDGLIKKTHITDFANVRRSGIIAIKLQKGDQLQWVKISSGKDEIILSSSQGQAIRFKERDLRPLGRAASGVRAMRLKKDDFIAGLDIIHEGVGAKTNVLTVTENGFSKQTPLKEYKVQKRGGSGIKTAKVNAKTGRVIGAKILTENEEELLALSSKGQMIRTKITSIRVAGRATSGVRIMKLNSGDKVVGVVCL